MTGLFECRRCGARVSAHHVSEAPPSLCPLCEGALKQVPESNAVQDPDDRSTGPARVRYCVNRDGGLP